MEFSIRYNIVLLLKVHRTIVVDPVCRRYINRNGNVGMVTAGSGDVLTGLLAGLMAQGYSPEETAKLGVFLHGLSADLALTKQSEESMIARDIVCHIGEAFSSLTVK